MAKNAVWCTKARLNLKPSDELGLGGSRACFGVLENEFYNCLWTSDSNRPTEMWCTKDSVKG